MAQKIENKKCRVCGEMFKPYSPYVKAAALQLNCSRACANRYRAILREEARRTMGAASKTEKKEERAPESPSETSERKSRKKRSDFHPFRGAKPDYFFDVRAAVNRAYARMVEEGRIIDFSK